MAGTAGNGYLPSLYVGTTRQAAFGQDLAGAMWLLNAIAARAAVSRMRTILDVWLAVTVLMSLPDFSLAFFYSEPPFLCRLVYGEQLSTDRQLHGAGRLARGNNDALCATSQRDHLQRRERAHRLMSVDEATAAIAHEIRQPLACDVTKLRHSVGISQSGAPRCRRATFLSNGREEREQSRERNSLGVRALFKSTASSKNDS